MRRLTSLLLFLLIFPLWSTSCKSKKVAAKTQPLHPAYSQPYVSPKKEMRAAWLPTVYRTEYQGKSKEEVQALLRSKLDYLAQAGFNVVIFQVRPESDAFYYSPFEPWSQFFTGAQGKAPSPLWDPLQFLVQECHKRQIEIHAWLNPYRAAVNAQAQLAPQHPYHRNPHWFVIYGKQLYYNPALPEVRNYTCQVVQDLVQRYDIDAVHMDDYFYPYPIAGEPFPDQQHFLANPRGFDNISDWRRDNVNLLIEQLHHTIKSTKPYVRFGISPFGIYRNIKSTPTGSLTSGLQNYDDLFADILLWDQNGWVDYLMPQLYWEMGHKAADYTELAHWWQRNIHNAHYYIGQDVRRTMNAQQLHPKMVIATQVAQGVCMWPGDDILTNYKSITTLLTQKYWQHKVLLPPTPYPSGYPSFPEPPRQAGVMPLPDGTQELFWEVDLPYPPGLETKFYVIYNHERGTSLQEAVEPQHIMATTQSNILPLLHLGNKFKRALTITRVDRFNHEHLVAHNIHVTL